MANSLVVVVWLASMLVISFATTTVNGSLQESVEVTWGDQRAQFLENGQQLKLNLDEASGSGFRSKDEYVFAQVSMQLKLVEGNAAGTVTAFYLSSIGEGHDEIDFEFLGNMSGSPYTLHTNVFVGGKGDREQQFFLWFDPTKDFHTYTILWNEKNIIFLVDDTPIRVYKNNEANGVAYPTKQAMRVYSSLWEADDWATQGGRVKIDWSNAPFVASYRAYTAVACISSSSSSSTGGGAVSCQSGAWMDRELDAAEKNKLEMVQKNYMVYDYCKDINRFGTEANIPKECGMA